MDAREIAKAVGVRFDGAQQTMRKQSLLLFTEMSTESTFAVWESDLSLSVVQGKKDELLARYQN